MARRGARKIRWKETVTPCAFETSTDEFLAALAKVSGVLTLNEIKPEDQIVMVTAKDGRVVVESGMRGSYARVVIPGETDAAGYFVTGIDVLQLRYGSKSVSFRTQPKAGKIHYTARIKGFVVSSGKPETVERNRPTKKPDFVQVEREVFEHVFTHVNFNADVIDDNPDILIRFSVVEREQKSRDIRSKKQYELKMAVHDLFRVAIGSEPCHASGTSSPCVFQASCVDKFLRSLHKEDEEVSVGLGDDVIWLKSGDFVSVSPLLQGSAYDVEKWVRSFEGEEPEFEFMVEPAPVFDTVRNVMSVQKSSRAKKDSESRLQVKVSGGKIHFSLRSSTGLAEASTEIKRGQSGRVDVDAGFLNSALGMMKKANDLRFTVWGARVRMSVLDHYNTSHYFATMKEDKYE